MSAVCCNVKDSEGCDLSYSPGRCENEVAETQLKLIEDPFIASTVQPKYPDGKAQWSIGVKYQKATEIRSHKFFVVLFPGVNNWCMCFDYVKNYESGIELPALYCRMLANHHSENRPHAVSYNVNTAVVNSEDGSIANNGDTMPRTWHWTWSPTTETPYNSWRPVYCAMRIQNVANKETDNGMFQCFRTTRDGAMEMFGYARELNKNIPKKKKNDTTFINGNLTPMGNYFQPLIDGIREYEAQPSYSYNNFASFTHYTFQLNHMREENHFLKLRDASMSASQSMKRFYRWPTQTLGPEYPVPDFSKKDVDTEFYLTKRLKSHLKNYQITTHPKEEANQTDFNHFIHAVEDLEDELEAPEKALEETTAMNNTFYGVKDFGARADEIKWEEVRREGVDQFMSDAFDVIVVLVEGDENDRFVVHSSYAQEYLVNDNAQLASFQTPAYNISSKLQKYQEKRKLYHKIPYHYQTNNGKQGIFKDML